MATASYFSLSAIQQEFSANEYELLLAFLTDAGISYYFGDSPYNASKRGGLMTVAQFIGGWATDAIIGGGYVSNYVSSTNNVAQLLIKFSIASLAFLELNRYVLGSELDTMSLLEESGLTTVVAQYGGKWLSGMYANPVVVDQSQ